jgi:hypothetical protein
MSAARREAQLDDENLLRHTAAQSPTLGGPEERVTLLVALLFDPMKAIRFTALPTGLRSAPPPRI